MEKLKIAHNHTLTDILKVCVYAIVLCAPFFAVLFECLYASFNKGSSTAYTMPETAFYTALDRITNQPVFNWTQNTALYTGINAVCTNLEMGANHVIAILLTYMTIITIIYVIFDIVINVFKWLTHMVNEK